jgi:hypothetical protein
LHPGPVGGGSARLPAAADEDARATRSALCDHLLGEAALADAGLADEQEQAPPAGKGIIETPDQLGQLARAAHKRAARGLQCRLACRRRLRGGEMELRVLREYRSFELA